MVNRCKKNISNGLICKKKNKKNNNNNNNNDNNNNNNSILTYNTLTIRIR